MSQDQQEATSAEPVTNRRISAGVRLMGWLTTTDHKVIGNLYMVTAFGFFLLAGLLAMLMRAELARPGLQIVSAAQYNQLFTVHGTIMMLLFATPMFAGFANAVMPLQIGSPDVAFPRLNALTYWLFLFGGLIVVSGFVVPGGAAAFGWFAYAPLNSAVFSPGPGGAGHLHVQSAALAAHTAADVVHRRREAVGVPGRTDRQREQRRVAVA